MRVSAPCFLLVDDHALFRMGLALMLPQGWPDARVIQAASWGEAWLILHKETPDLIMLDVRLPDGHGVADLAAIRRHAPGTPVLLMSAEVEMAEVAHARREGAVGFLPKSAAAADVLAAVRDALAGGTAFAAVPYGMPGDVPGDVPDAAASIHANEAPATFNPRQIDILRYLGRGTPNKAIARHMGMSEAEVRAEVSWLTESLGARSREEAYAAAVARGLVTP